MDPLSLTIATITLVEGISSTYKAIQHLKGLPKAFQKVNESLPLVEETLKSAEETLRSRGTLPRDVAKPIQNTINTCHKKTEALLTIFQKIEDQNKEYRERKDGKEWSVMDIYLPILQTWGRMAKAHRVEALMQDTLNALKVLAINQVFKTATHTQVARLEVAIEELAKVEPSVPDSDSDDGGTVNVTQNVASGGKGNQAFNKGGHQENTFGSRFDSGGGVMNFGTVPSE